MYYLYILFSAKHDKYYIGHSNSPYERVNHHNSDEKNTYTSKYRPWELAAIFEVGGTRSDALTIERWVKKQKSRKLLEKLTDPAFVPDRQLAQLVRVPHVRD